MNKKTRILALVLAILMLVGVMPLSLFATEEAPEAEAAAEDVSILDALAAKAEGSLYEGITAPEGASLKFTNSSSTGPNKLKDLYVDSGWGDKSKVLVDTNNDINGSTNTDISFFFSPEKEVNGDDRYYVTSFNVRRGEAFYNPYEYIFRAFIKAYKVTTVYNADGSVADKNTASSYEKVTDAIVKCSYDGSGIYISADCNDTGAKIPLEIFGTETYTNFGFILDAEENKAYYYMNGILVGTRTDFLPATETVSGENGSYTVTSYDYKVKVDVMCHTYNPYAGVFLHSGKYTTFITSDRTKVFAEDGSFLQENKTPANGVFKIRGAYYYYEDGMLLGGQTVTVDGYNLELDARSGRILAVYTNTAEEVGEKHAEITDYSISLAEKIHLNIYAKVDTLASDNGAYALLTVGDEVQKIMLSSLTKENDKYKITAKLSSIQLSEEVKIEIFDGEGNKLEIIKDNRVADFWTFSVQRYAEYIIANEDTYGTEAADLAKSVLLYGAFAERHFAGEKGLATARVLGRFEKLAVQYGTVGTFYTNVGIDKNNLFTKTLNDKTADVNLTASATDTSMLGDVYLVLNSTIKIRIALNVTEAPVSIEGGVLYTETNDGETKYYVDIAGLTAKDLNTVNTVVINGKNTVKVTALAAANAVVTAGDATYGKTFTDLMKAMYLYYYYADAYVKAQA